MASPAGTPPDQLSAPLHARNPQQAIPIIDRSASSTETSLPGSAGGARHREKKRVGFLNAAGSGARLSLADHPIELKRLSTTDANNVDAHPQSSTRGRSISPTPHYSQQDSNDDDATTNRDHLPQLSLQQTRDIHEALHRSLTTRPRPAIRFSETIQATQVDESESEQPDPDGQRAHRRARARAALERGRRLAEDEKAQSAPNTRSASLERPARVARPPALHLGDLPPPDIATSAVLDTPDSELTQHDGIFDEAKSLDDPTNWGPLSPPYLTREMPSLITDPHSGIATPTDERDLIDDYQPKPDKYRGGILGSLLKLQGSRSSHEHRRRSSSVPRQVHLRQGSDTGIYGFGPASASSTPAHSPGSSGTATPTGSYFHLGRKHKNHSSSSLAQLIGSSASLGSTGFAAFGESVNARLREHAATTHKSSRRGVFGHLTRSRLAEEIRIKHHIAETILRQKYLLRLCHALMMYGAPTHRLEEYMKMSARVLEIEAQFLYIPGSMIMSFDDLSTHTTEVKLVRCNQGLDLGKLRDVHEVYKEVVHDRIGVEEATVRLKEVTSKKDKHSRWFRIPIYGLAAASVGPFAFGARFIDLPIAFILGCILGFLQLVVAPRSDIYANVFEIGATIITSFLARAFGSIRGGDLFCFSALAQSSIALILPGYTVLCASLELQSKSLIAGSVRMVYAIIYSLFLGYGITIGALIYGALDHNATSEYMCRQPMEAPLYFIFVPIFTLCLLIINQAKWKQAPVMLVISCVGYLVNFYSSKRFAGNTQISNSFGAFAIGVMANLYSRVGARLGNFLLDVWEDRLQLRWTSLRRRMRGISDRNPSSIRSMEEGLVPDRASVFTRQTRRIGYGLAAAAMLPAIFVQVPSGLSVTGSLISGLASANQIANHATNGSVVANATSLYENQAINSTALTVGYSVIQIAIGITVGLFVSALFVYPCGKRRSGLFSF